MISGFNAVNWTSTGSCNLMATDIDILPFCWHLFSHKWHLCHIIMQNCRWFIKILLLSFQCFDLCRLSFFCFKIFSVMINNLHVSLQIPSPNKWLYCTRSANKKNDSLMWQWDCSTQPLMSSYSPQSYSVFSSVSLLGCIRSCLTAQCAYRPSVTVSAKLENLSIALLW